MGFVRSPFGGLSGPLRICGLEEPPAEGASIHPTNAAEQQHIYRYAQMCIKEGIPGHPSLAVRCVP